MKRVSHIRTKVVSTTHKIELHKHDIIELLAKEGVVVPVNASITFHVPGGGDWSNEDLDIGADCPVKITWTTVEDDN